MTKRVIVCYSCGLEYYADEAKESIEIDNSIGWKYTVYKCPHCGKKVCDELKRIEI